MQFIELDGAQGEGGGQILRTALTLSMITGQSFRIENIRAKRAKPGLLRQHLTAVNAATEICGAKVDGAEPGSLALSFVPNHIKGGNYRFSIGTAGSCTLVLQTILPALWFADKPSNVVVTGGTHNSAAPPADFLMRAWLPLMKRMGVEMTLDLIRHGFYPAGGGEIRVSVNPIDALQPLYLNERGNWLATKATAIIAGIPGDVAKRELATLSERLGTMEQNIRGLPSGEGPGNVLLVELCFDNLTEIFAAFGEKGVRAETVAERVAREVRQYMSSTASVGEHLADQLALPMALTGKGCFATTHVSSHLRTNLDVISKFLPHNFEVGDYKDFALVSLC